MSVLLRPEMDLRRIGGIALVAGAAAREALAFLCAQPIDVYWPNDLQLLGRKLGGILAEARTRGGGKAVVVALGIGLNIDLEGIEVPPGLWGSIASLADAGIRERDPEAIAVKILERLRPLIGALEDGAPIPSLVRGAIAGLGRPVRVTVPPAPAWNGIAVGIGTEGELLVLRDGGGIEALRAAEVEYQR